MPDRAVSVIAKDYHWRDLSVGRLPDSGLGHFTPLVRLLIKNRAFREPSLVIAVFIRVSGGQWASPNKMRRWRLGACTWRDAESKAMLVKMAEAWVKLAERLKAEAEQGSV